MTKITDVPDTYYIGLQAGSDLDREKFPLAFATPGGSDAAAEKRKRTVDEWSSRRRYVGKYPDGYLTTTPGPRYEMKNDWMTGFAFNSITSRSRTDNKVFDILDPRGFSLQIYSDCMEDILLDGTIIKGEIQGECKWARSGGKMYLMVKNTPIHREWEEYIENKKAQAGTRMVPGDIIVYDTKGNHRQIYLGNVYKIQARFTDTTTRNYWSYHTANHIFKMNVEVDEKPWKALVSASDSSYNHLDVKRSWPKHMLKVGHDDELLELKLKEMKFDVVPALNDWQPITIYFSSLQKLRDFVEEHGPDYKIFRDMWEEKESLRRSKTYNSTLL